MALGGLEADARVKVDGCRAPHLEVVTAAVKPVTGLIVGLCSIASVHRSCMVSGLSHDGATLPAVALFRITSPRA
jgi:hypothetical protein